MRYLVKILFFLLFTIQISCAQTTIVDRPTCENTVFDSKVEKTISFTVPLIGVEELVNNMDQYEVFDTRKKEEYEMSHIPGAKYLGYRDFDIAKLNDLPKETPIVLYCSIGYRSEKIGEELIDAGYTNVFNLYGSLFEWVNQENEIVDKDGLPTKEVHTYNRSWSKWVDENKAIKKW